LDTFKLINKAIADGITMKQLCILMYLLDNQGEDYLNEIVKNTGVSLSVVGRMPIMHPYFVKTKELKKRKVLGGSRPLTSGLALTSKGKTYLQSYFRK
jgi:hypothetical protein